MKRCRICEETKPFDAFYAMRGMRDGYRNECKACNLAQRAAKYSRDPEMRERAVTRTRKWQSENPEQYRATQARYKAEGRLSLSARKSHLKRKFGMTPEDYEARLREQGGGCECASGRRSRDSPSTSTTTT